MRVYSVILRERRALRSADIEVTYVDLELRFRFVSQYHATIILHTHVTPCDLIHHNRMGFLNVNDVPPPPSLVWVRRVNEVDPRPSFESKVAEVCIVWLNGIDRAHNLEGIKSTYLT